jgi:hypothetical protein
VAGHVRLELRNVVAKYPVERSHGFPASQPNSGHGDYSRLSCGVQETQLGPDARISANSEHDPAAANPATPLLTLCWTFSVKRACVVVTGSEPDRLSPLPRQRPWGLRGVWWWRRDVLRRHDREECCPNVQAQRCAKRVRRDRSPKFNLARATKRIYIRIIVPRPSPPHTRHERSPGAYFAGASPFLSETLECRCFVDAPNMVETLKQILAVAQRLVGK